MKIPSVLISTLSLFAALSLGNVYADDDKAKAEVHEHEAESHEQHGAHEHGVATLSIALGSEGLEIMLESPAANIVGFEHAASSDEDKQKLTDIKAKLEAGADLFSLNSEAECTLSSVEVVSALLGNAETKKEDHDHQDSDKEEHTDHEHEEGETHSDMDVTWSFACAKPAELKEVTTKLFAAFPEGFQEIKAEWVTDKGASAQELDKDSTITLN